MKYRGYEITSDKYQWIVHALGEPRIAEKGGPRWEAGDIVTPNPERTYHGTLTQVAGYIIDREAKKCETLEGVIELLKSAKEVLKIELKSDIKTKRGDIT